MKRIIIVTLLLSISWTGYSQDKIITHRGDTLQCKVTEVTDKGVKYKFDGEDLINNISKNLVQEIKFSTGRVQKMTDKITINGEEDWEKVQITNLESDVEGLSRKQELMAKASSGWSTTNQGKMEKKAMDKLKKEAAAIGCHMVLILTTTGKGGHYGISGGTKASVTGVAYSYK